MQGQIKKKSLALLYTNDKKAGNEIRDMNFTTATNNIKHLWVTLTKEV